MSNHISRRVTPQEENIEAARFDLPEKSNARTNERHEAVPTSCKLIPYLFDIRSILRMIKRNARIWSKSSLQSLMGANQFTQLRM